MPKFFKIKFLIISIFLLLIVVLAFSCTPIPQRQVVDPQFESERFGYLQDGKINRQEIKDRLGNPRHSYENGRIVIYSWIDMKSDVYITYDIVLIFNENDILERHSVVRGR